MPHPMDQHAGKRDKRQRPRRFAQGARAVGRSSCLVWFTYARQLPGNVVNKALYFLARQMRGVPVEYGLDDDCQYAECWQVRFRPDLSLDDVVRMARIAIPDKYADVAFIEVTYSHGGHENWRGAAGSGEAVRRKIRTRYHDAVDSGEAALQGFYLAMSPWLTTTVGEGKDAYQLPIALPAMSLADGLDAMCRNLIGGPLPLAWREQEGWLEMYADWSRLELRWQRYIDGMCDDTVGKPEYERWFAAKQACDGWIASKLPYARHGIAALIAAIAAANKPQVAVKAP